MSDYIAFAIRHSNDCSRVICWSRQGPTADRAAVRRSSHPTLHVGDISNEGSNPYTVLTATTGVHILRVFRFALHDRQPRLVRNWVQGSPRMSTWCKEIRESSTCAERRRHRHHLRDHSAVRVLRNTLLPSYYFGKCASFGSVSAKTYINHNTTHAMCETCAFSNCFISVFRSFACSSLCTVMYCDGLYRSLEMYCTVLHATGLYCTEQ